MKVKEDKIAIIITVITAGLMAVVLGVLCGFPEFHSEAMALAERTEESGGLSVLSLLRDDSVLLDTSEDYAETKEHQLRLQIPTTTDMDKVEIKDNYMTQSITIEIPGIGNTYFYDYPMIGATDGIMDVWYEISDGVGMIDIKMDAVYECETTVKDQYIYLDFVSPHEIYDYVVTIDAGHGGIDVGANVGEVYEKDINLAVVEKIKQLFDADEHNIGVYYTRTDDSDMSLAERVNLANGVGSDVFVSVHVNSTDSGRESGIHGTSVLYKVSDESGASMNLAQNCLDGLLGQLGSLSKGIVAGDEIKIIRLSEAPVALCEIGFITNSDERELLLNEDYQAKAAQGIYEGILKSIGIEE